METLLKDENTITYLIECRAEKIVSLDFRVYQVTAWTAENEVCHEDNELFLTGSIKFDGCSHITFGDEGDGYLHLCGKKYFDDLKRVLDAIWQKANNELNMLK